MIEYNDLVDMDEFIDNEDYYDDLWNMTIFDPIPGQIECSLFDIEFFDDDTIAISIRCEQNYPFEEMLFIKELKINGRYYHNHNIPEDGYDIDPFEEQIRTFEIYGLEQKREKAVDVLEFYIEFAGFKSKTYSLYYNLESERGLLNCSETEEKENDKIGKTISRNFELFSELDDLIGLKNVKSDVDYSGRSAHALKRVQRTEIVV